MEIMTRQQAIDSGLPKYFTGKPCSNGHLVERLVTNYNCTSCTREINDNLRGRAPRKETVLRLAVLEKFGNRCGHCGYDTDLRALQIDHVNGGGGRERKGLGYYGALKLAANDTEGRYQVLCANCNVLKRLDNKE